MIDPNVDPKTGMALPRVVCAAMRNPQGDIVTGARHYDSITRKHIDRLKGELGEDAWNKQGIEQGFIDQFGNFLTREEAWVIAEERGQIYRRCSGDGKKLFSENLY